MRRSAVALSLALVCVGCPEVARAEPPAPQGEPERSESPQAGWKQFIQPDALAFVWGSAAVAAAAHLALEPPEEPRFFPIDEGGELRGSETIPNWQVGVGVAVAPFLVGLSGTPSRWYHAKGISQSILTTAALTELAKNAFGRHRPSFDPETSVDDDRKSFFSGHSSLTWSVTVYSGLYLHGHVFSQWRGDSAFAWWETGPYLALGALSVWVPYTRLQDKKHHLSDVVTGAAVGMTMSIVFYTWQDHRYRAGETRVVLTPLTDRPGLAVSGRF